RGPLGKFFAWFNRIFERATEGYIRWSALLIRKSAIALAMLVAFGLAAFFFSTRVPTSFLPDEDFGYMYVNMQLPNAASLGRTNEAGRHVEKILSEMPGVRYTTSIIGFSLLSYVRASYNAFFFVTLKPWDERKGREEQYQVIKQRLNQELSKLPEGVAFGFSPPALPGV